MTITLLSDPATTSLSFERRMTNPIEAERNLSAKEHVTQNVFRELEAALDLAKGLGTGPYLHHDVGSVARVLDREGQALASGIGDVSNLTAGGGDPTADAVGGSYRCILGRVGTKNEGKLVVSHQE